MFVPQSHVAELRALEAVDRGGVAHPQREEAHVARLLLAASHDGHGLRGVVHRQAHTQSWSSRSTCELPLVFFHDDLHAVDKIVVLLLVSRQEQAQPFEKCDLGSFAESPPRLVIVQIVGVNTIDLAERARSAAGCSWACRACSSCCPGRSKSEGRKRTAAK